MDHMRSFVDLACLVHVNICSDGIPINQHDKQRFTIDK